MTVAPPMGSIQARRIPFYGDLIHANVAPQWTVATGVSSYPDQIVSGAPCDWAQATGANQPSVSTFTTQPALSFDSTDYLQTTGALAAQNVITLSFPALLVGGNRVVFESSAAAGIANPGSFLIYENGGNLNLEYYRGGTTRKFVAITPGLKRIVVVLNPAASGADAWPALYINGASAGAYGVIGATTGQIASYVWTLGRFAAGGFPWTGGKTSTILQHGRALTAGEIALVDAYLATVSA